MGARPACIVDHARARPAARALAMSDGTETLTFAALEARSRALAGQIGAAGCAPGDHVAILIENRADFMVALWGCHRAGVHYTPVNWHLSSAEAAYIVRDCGARLILSSSGLAALATEASGGGELWLCPGDGPSGFARIDGEVPPAAASPEREGAAMLYSSGTSGQPKGIKRALSGERFGAWSASDEMMRALYDFGPHTVLLCPAPLYHAAPMNFSMSAQRAGGRVILMPSFDAEQALQAIEREQATAAWLVPTMMIRLLQLDPARRAQAKLGSLTHIVHAGAPCPVEVKRRMMEWMGPILHEFYGATEGNGFTAIGPQEWLAHPGSVGRSDAVRIVGEDGMVLGPGEVGLVYFATSWVPFEYHNDPAKTAGAIDARGWSTLGDIGFVDADGYLFLTDRKSHMIISGGVNIYPQEVENLLASHPLVADSAVIGVPDADLGEAVKAVVVLHDPGLATPRTETEIIGYCRARLARFKCPRSVDFVDTLPRMPTGKLLKRLLRDRYWPPA